MTQSTSNTSFNITVYFIVISIDDSFLFVLQNKISSNKISLTLLYFFFCFKEQSEKNLRPSNKTKYPIHQSPYDK